MASQNHHDSWADSLREPYELYLQREEAKRAEKKLLARLKRTDFDSYLQEIRTRRKAKYANSLTKIPFNLEAWANTRLAFNGRDKLNSTKPHDALYSYDIEERRGIYTLLDVILLSLGIRTVPEECKAKDCEKNVPNYYSNQIGNHSKLDNDVWKLNFTEILSLVKHDDRLNWLKFNYLLALITLLLTSFNVVSSFAKPNVGILILICCTGMIVSFWADLTFQEGLRCLRGHKRKVSLLEQQTPNKKDLSFIFYNNTYNQRDVLEIAPAIIFLTFFSLTLYLASKYYLYPTGVIS